MPDWFVNVGTWGALDWLAAAGALAGIVGAIAAVIALRRRRGPTQHTGDGGVNIGGDNHGDITTGDDPGRGA